MSRQFPVIRGIAILYVLLNHSITMSLWMASRFNYQPPSQALNAVLVSLQEVGIYAVPAFLVPFRRFLCLRSPKPFNAGLV